MDERELKVHAKECGKLMQVLEEEGDVMGEPSFRKLNPIEAELGLKADMLLWTYVFPEEKRPCEGVDTAW
jgi:hypothetical protein